MADKTTIIAGIVIRSDSPLFQTLVGLHVLVALACVITGVLAMLSNKRPGQHPVFGAIYYWCLSVVFAWAAVLSAMRRADDYHLSLATDRAPVSGRLRLKQVVSQSFSATRRAAPGEHDACTRNKPNRQKQDPLRHCRRGEPGDCGGDE